MGKTRLDAFSDGVIAIIITIMVLELKVPHSPDFQALLPLWPVFLSYVLSFIYVGIYWNNHHHMLHLVENINGKVMWANLHVLFWVSLFPFTTAWLNEAHGNGGEFPATLPTLVYGVVLLMAGVAYLVTERLMVRENGPRSILAEAVGSDRKGLVSLIGYVVAIVLAFVSASLADLIYALVAGMLIVPDRRIARRTGGAK